MGDIYNPERNPSQRRFKDKWVVDDGKWLANQLSRPMDDQTSPTAASGGGDEMAAISGAMLGAYVGTSLFSTAMGAIGQSKANTTQREANEAAQRLARAELEYDIGENWQTYQRAKPRMQVADSVFRSTIAETGIPGLQRQVAPEVVEGAWEGPPRTLAELEAEGSGPGGGGRARAIPSGYMRDMRDPAIDDPTQRGTMGDMLTNRRV